MWCRLDSCLSRCKCSRDRDMVCCNLWHRYTHRYTHRYSHIVPCNQSTEPKRGRQDGHDTYYQTEVLSDLLSACSMRTMIMFYAVRLHHWDTFAFMASLKCRATHNFGSFVFGCWGLGLQHRQTVDKYEGEFDHQVSLCHAIILSSCHLMMLHSHLVAYHPWPDTLLLPTWCMTCNIVELWSEMT